MTSDAKIGLLLGLVFIFIIAFIINGLPSFRNQEDPNELTNRMMRSQKEDLGVGQQGRRVIGQTEQIGKRTQPVPAPPSAMEDEVRHRISLADIPPIAKETDRPDLTIPGSPQPPTVDKDNRVTEPGKPALPATYVVAEGDSLAAIAQKLYGAVEGNRRMNVARIFEANRQVLRSPDEVYPGQKLIIPSLSGNDLKRKPDNVLGGNMFEKVESIGRRYFSKGDAEPKASRQYVVREGDSLWRIAADQLGDGNRYKEILRLNTDKLENENRVVVGMSLRMPSLESR